MNLETKINEINEHFKVPIYYNEKKILLNKSISKDLELIETIDPSCEPIYTFCFNNDNSVSKKINEQISEYYTTDINYLKDTQTLLKEYKPLCVKYTDYSNNYKSIVDIWNELKISAGFKERYYFVEWEMFEFLNHSQHFLQFVSIYNLLSPIISLLVPIIILIIPFFIIKMKNIPITLTEYFEVLKIVASQNAIGKLFVVNFKEIKTQEQFYIFISAAFYLFSIYQNFMVCVRFNNNMKNIHNYFNELRIYIDHTTKSMENYLEYSNNLHTQQTFNSIVKNNLNTLKSMYNKIAFITDYNMFNFSKIKEIGYVFKCFYELHVNKTYDDAIIYSLGFNGYLDCLKGLQQNIIERKINFASFSEKTSTSIENSYYAPLKNGTPTKNTIKLKKNIIITGPNASGKTTILKSTLINVLFSQQFGCGFYEKASLKPFNHIHCYLNIPDTSGRDSLFQAEARRCKEILDAIHNAEDGVTHLCAFDELYSGTNPEEAEQSAISFMRYITKYKNVFCMLTTHFIKVCKKLNKLKNVVNYKMLTESDGYNLKYKYILTEGISDVKGGLIVLKQMNYPIEIVNNI